MCNSDGKITIDSNSSDSISEPTYSVVFIWLFIFILSFT